jgi:signal transduction histidine kinase
MIIQEMMVNRGGDEPEPLLRTSMITMAGTEPSTVAALTKLLGGASEDAATLRAEMVKRMAMMSNPGVPLVGNQDLLASLQTTSKIAEQIIGDATSAIPAAVEAEAADARNDAIRDAVLVAIAVISALVIVLLVARSLVRPLRTLRDSALKVAHEDLAKEIERVRAGGEPAPITPLPVYTSEEVGQVAHAVDELHEQAVFLAGEQAQLQLQVADMFETLSRRSRSLVDQQLSLIDELERNEDDPQRLESLFRLDHLAARMRRNGANLLVLSGAKVTREHSAPVAVATIINAAASEVEDYTRVVTVDVADAEIVGSAAGDLIHLLAELLDNALRYSPPISQVRVSAVFAGNGALVIEVSDVGLGMTESDLRVANIRLQSGGEVNPYTARHMGLFVVGRLAGQHGLVVRLRSTIADEPASGTTAGVYVPAELLVGEDGTAVVDRFGDGHADSAPVDAHAGLTTVPALDSGSDSGSAAGADDHGLNGHADVPVGLLPQRNPGASGISEMPGVFAEPTAEPGASTAGQASDAPPTEWPQQWPEPDEAAPPANGVPADTGPTNTASFFASRAQVAGNGSRVPGDSRFEANGANAFRGSWGNADGHAGDQADHDADHHADHHAGTRTSNDGDSIYQSMVSEFAIDPTTHVRSSDLDWQTVWEKGWSVAAAAQDAPVDRHTEEGLPMRTPGARLVPGGVAAAAGVTNGTNGTNGHHRNGHLGGHLGDPLERNLPGETHRTDNGVEAVASADEADSGIFAAFTPRDPEAVRASISSHFGGVHAGRAHARETRGTDNE